MPPNLAPVLSSLLLGACSVIGIRDGTEEPRFDVVAHAGPAEIRRYAPRIAAETTLQATELDARSRGFQRLAGYIFGANTTKAAIPMTAPVTQAASERIAMTAPVTQNRSPGGAWTIRFFMPARYTLDTLPTPTDPAVSLVPVPAQTYAVLRFTGSTAPEAVAAQQAELSRALEGTPWQANGLPLAWFYDPPWTLPFLRRNEVAIPLKHPG